jgi:hypothetical protein
LRTKEREIQNEDKFYHLNMSNSNKNKTKNYVDFMLFYYYFLSLSLSLLLKQVVWLIIELTQQIETSKQAECDDKSKIRKLERSIRTFEIEKDQLFKVKYFLINSLSLYT